MVKESFYREEKNLSEIIEIECYWFDFLPVTRNL